MSAPDRRAEAPDNLLDLSDENLCLVAEMTADALRRYTEQAGAADILVACAKRLRRLPAPSVAPSDAEVEALAAKCELDATTSVWLTDDEMRQVAAALRSLLAARSRRSALEALGERALETLRYKPSELPEMRCENVVGLIAGWAAALGLLRGEPEKGDGK